MADISCDIVVVGAGVLGLCVAVDLTGRGLDVRVVDPGGPNASSVAAGMIAPAFEALLDEADAARAALLRDAVALWPVFADRIGMTLDATPAEWRGPDGEAVATGLRALGFRVDRREGRVRAPDDVRIDPQAAMARLAARIAEPVVVAEALGIESVDPGWRVRTTAGLIAARQVVIATGAAPALPGLPAAVARWVDGIVPIAGQIGRSDQATTGVLRARDGYVAAAEGGMVVGATMVPGSRDPTPDPAASRRLAAVAERLLGHAPAGRIRWTGGVRGASPDGLPLAGPTGEPGLHLALAPRRNGWLLGPLVGRIVADGIEGRPSGPHAAALSPLRFAPSAAPGSAVNRP